MADVAKLQATVDGRGGTLTRGAKPLPQTPHALQALRGCLRRVPHGAAHGRRLRLSTITGQGEGGSATSWRSGRGAGAGFVVHMTGLGV